MNIELKDIYAKWNMVLVARLFGEKKEGIDVTDRSICTTTGYRFRGKMYITECTTKSRMTYD